MLRPPRAFVGNVNVGTATQETFAFHFRNGEFWMNTCHITDVKQLYKREGNDGEKFFLVFAGIDLNSLFRDTCFTGLYISLHR